MNKIISKLKGFRFYLVYAVTGLLFTTAVSIHAKAQHKRAINGEMAICKLQPNTNGNANKTTENNTRLKQVRVEDLYPNQIGYFDQISGIQPLETVIIEISYPDGNVGEKVLLSAEDGGKFENGKRIKLLQLDNQKKVFFDFQVSDQLGIYRVSLRKGNDTKVVQLWVGPEHSPSQNSVTSGKN